MHTRLPDYDKIYRDIPSTILLNEIPYVTKEDRTYYNSLLMTRTQTDILNSVPSCACGKYQYVYNSGRVCEVCDTVVELLNESDIDSNIWIMAPDCVHGFISPYLWNKITQLVTGRGYNILNWAVNPKSDVPRIATKITKKRIAALQSINWERGLNYFIENYEIFFDVMVSTADGISKAKLRREFRELATQSALFFPRYLPIPSKALMVIEDTALGSFADTSTMSYAVAAAKTIGVISIPRLPPLKPYSQRFIEVKVAEVCENLNLYASVTFSKNLCQKSGWLRSHVYKARSDWTGRAVVTSIPTPHYYNELHLPWGMAIEIFKYHIANKLRKNYDLTLTEETNLLEYAANNYHPIIGEIFDQLIAESVEIKHTFPDDIEFFQYRGLNDSQIKLLRLPTRGIPCTFQRNPTLGLGSMQPFLVTCIKRNIYDYTISFSDLAAPGFNADHDGDSGILVKLFVLVFTNIV